IVAAQTTKAELFRLYLSKSILFCRGGSYSEAASLLTLAERNISEAKEHEAKVSGGFILDGPRCSPPHLR
ncbi:hypothetical protein Tco_1158592, partial [Tanacetum coccineum]